MLPCAGMPIRYHPPTRRYPIDGQKLRALRTQHGYSVVTLGALANVASVELWRIEVGRRQARLVTIEKLATALGIAPNDLLLPASA